VVANVGRCEAPEALNSACDTGADLHSVRLSTQGARHPECGSNSPPSVEIIKRGRGGSRPNTGGARPGSGRKPKPKPEPVPAPVVLRGRRWLCAEVWGGRELQVLVGLQVLAGRRGFRLDTFLPLCRPAPGAVLEPAFPGYVFVLADLEEEAWRYLHRVPGVIGLLRHDAERPMVVPDAVVARLVVAFGVDGELTEAAYRPEWAPLKAGALVQVLEGPFAGQVARVQRDEGVMVLVEVSVFGRSLECKVPRLAIGPA
jgi:transcription antitermination factor NusG